MSTILMSQCVVAISIVSIIINASLQENVQIQVSRNTMIKFGTRRHQVLQLCLVTGFDRLFKGILSIHETEYENLFSQAQLTSNEVFIYVKCICV